jgi:hypothetical protein
VAPGPGRPSWSTPEEVAQRVRYIHDELGSRVRFPRAGGAPPGFQLAPFLWRQGGRQEALSMLWPIRRAPRPRPCAAADDALPALVRTGLVPRLSSSERRPGRPLTCRSPWRPVHGRQLLSGLC